jgi:small-conductance mechanosensitive channel
LILKNDNFRLGLVLGLLVPVAVFFIIYFLRFSTLSLSEFSAVLRQEPRLITFLSVWCLVANIGLFTLYINTNRYATGRGIFIITVVYGLLFLATKFLA